MSWVRFWMISNAWGQETGLCITMLLASTKCPAEFLLIRNLRSLHRSKSKRSWVSGPQECFLLLFTSTKRTDVSCTGDLSLSLNVPLARKTKSTSLSCPESASTQASSIFTYFLQGKSRKRQTLVANTATKVTTISTWSGKRMGSTRGRSRRVSRTCGNYTSKSSPRKMINSRQSFIGPIGWPTLKESWRKRSRQHRSSFREQPTFLFTVRQAPKLPLC